MKIEFKINESGKQYAKGYNALKGSIIDEHDFSIAMTATVLLGHKTDKLFEVFADKVLYIAVPFAKKDPFTKKDDPTYRAIKVLVIRDTQDKLYVWSLKPLTIEDGDVMFTTADEAKKFAAYTNGRNTLLEIRKVANARMEMYKAMVDYTDESIAEIDNEYNKK